MIHACHYCHLVAQSFSLTCLQPHGLLAGQAVQSMEFSRQEYWNGLPFPSPGRKKVVLTPVPSHKDPVSTQELECHHLENLLANLDRTVPNPEPLSRHKEQPWTPYVLLTKAVCLWGTIAQGRSETYSGGSQESGVQETPPSTESCPRMDVATWPSLHSAWNTGLGV